MTLSPATLKPLLAGLLTLASSGTFAECILDAGVFELARSTGGSVQCADKDYYRALGLSQSPPIPKGFEGNCVASGTKVVCKSGTLVDYGIPKPAPGVAVAPIPAKLLPRLGFTPVREPQWVDRPPEPGKWYGLSCLVRIWEKQLNGSQGPLLMYRHGARTDMKAVFAGAELTLGAQPDTFTGDKGIFDYQSLLALQFQGQEAFLKLETRKVGQCLQDVTSSCVRAEGRISREYLQRHSDSWQVSTPINVFVEDSCAQNANGYLLDARPFWYRIPVPH